jgi:hypothetical protein
MAYRVGFCPQCDEQVMVQDTNGLWNSFKPSYRQAYLVFEDGHRLKTVLCVTCLYQPDTQKIFEALTDPESMASTPEGIAEWKARGNPVKMEGVR